MGKTIRWKNTPAPPGKAYCPTPLEHVANCMTHLFLVPVSLVAPIRLYSKSKTHSEVITSAIYGITIVCLFLTSSAFHLCAFLARNSSIRCFLHVCDRVAIYLFIAGSYTPWFVLREFHAHWGWFMLFLVWICTMAGIAYQCFYHERFKWVELMIYLAIGLLPASTVIYMHEWSGVHLLAWGGITYIMGVIFFKMDGRIPLAHAIWHCFVSAGAYLHFCAVDGFLIVGMS